MPEEFFTNRMQKAKLSKHDGTFLISDLNSVDKCVPQGSILGPLLFTLYTSDIITACIKSGKYHLYADDLYLYLSFHLTGSTAGADLIKENLHCIDIWSDNNALVWNPI